MKKNIKVYAIDGWYWHGLELDGHLYLLDRLGRVGDCLRF